MLNAELPSSTYNVKFVGGQNNTYVFESASGITYEVLFISSGYIFAQNADFQDDVFEFVSRLTDYKADKLPLADSMIQATVIRIFEDFYQRRGMVAVYICDSSDNRQAVRARMFNRWFANYRHLGFVKVDAILDDPAGQIYTSLLVHPSYRYAGAVAAAFLKLIEEENTQKLSDE